MSTSRVRHIPYSTGHDCPVDRVVAVGKVAAQVGRQIVVALEPDAAVRADQLVTFRTPPLPIEDPATKQYLGCYQTVYARGTIEQVVGRIAMVRMPELWKLDTGWLVHRE